jgi:hypothetical protein
MFLKLIIPPLRRNEFHGAHLVETFGQSKDKVLRGRLA